MDDTVTNRTYGYRYNPGGNLTGMDVYDQYIDPDDTEYTDYNLLTTRDYRYQDSGNWKDLQTYYFGSTITYDNICFLISNNYVQKEMREENPLSFLLVMVFCYNSIKQ